MKQRLNASGCVGNGFAPEGLAGLGIEKGAGEGIFGNVPPIKPLYQA